jgi:rfaE bifunctional protein kinase chain/domain
MQQFTPAELKELRQKFSGKKIAVVGDMMLDGYYWGDVRRISPEAPVPVVEIEKEFFRLGGAANVILNVNSLGGKPYPIGIIGNDQEGKIFNELLNENGIEPEGLILTGQRPTTVKIRVIADNQHIVRIDKEKKDNIPADLENEIISKVGEIIGEVDAVILQDYNKGVLTENTIKAIIKLADDYKKIISVDPKFLNFFSYKNVSVFKPNKKETEDAFNIRISTDEDIEKAGKMLLDSLHADHVLLTLGAKGIALFDDKNNSSRIPTIARKVSDVSGAGDTVIATLTIALAAGIEIKKASYLANYAGGLVCEEIGIVPINLDTLINALLDDIE